MFCGPEIVDVSRGEAEGNIGSRGSTKHSFPEVSVNKYFIIYQESKKRNYKANFTRKYMKYFINFLKKR